MSSDERPRILLVDDEPTVREVCSELLTEVGYSVETAINGVEALKKLDGHFDAIVLDVNMPHLDGIDLFRKATARRPSLRGKFLFITGNLSGELDAVTVFLQMDKRVLKKPFTKDDFLRNLAEIAGQPNPSR